MSSEETVVCPLCNEHVDELTYPIHESVDRVVIAWIRRKHPEWVSEDGACQRCIEVYRQMKASGGHLPDSETPA